MKSVRFIGYRSRAEILSKYSFNTKKTPEKKRKIMKKNSLTGKSVYFLTVITLFLALTGAVSAQPGALDTTFGTGGAATTNVSTSDDEILATAIQSDNKIVTVGYSGKPAEFTIVRYNTNGSLDTTFGTNGIVKTTFNDISFARAVAIQSDGKIVVGGVAESKFALARYTTSGQLDSGFGSQGKVLTSVGTTSSINEIAIQSDGKIVAAGYTEKLGDFAVARYTTAGALDTTFGGGDGITITDFFGDDDRAESVKLQADGKILLAGSSVDGDLFTNFALARYNTDGSLDTNFGSAGIVATVTNCGANAGGCNANDLEVQSDGKIVITGSLDDIYLIRYTASGSLDTTFGSNGVVATNIGGNYDNAYELVIDAAGRILVSGSTISNGNEDMVVAKYLSTGVLDTSFDNGDGIVTITLGSNSDIAYSISLQSGGGIIVSGSKGDFGSKEFATARLIGVQPTAANATISGMITKSTGGGASQVRVSLIDGMGNTSYAITNSFGYYSFTNVPVGQTYILIANHKFYTFTPSSRVINLMEDFTMANFVANE